MPALFKTIPNAAQGFVHQGPVIASAPNYFEILKSIVKIPGHFVSTLFTSQTGATFEVGNFESEKLLLQIQTLKIFTWQCVSFFQEKATFNPSLTNCGNFQTTLECCKSSFFGINRGNSFTLHSRTALHSGVFLGGGGVIR